MGLWNVSNVTSMKFSHLEMRVLGSVPRGAAVLVPGENLPKELANLKTLSLN